MNFIYVSEANTNPDTGEEISIAHSTQYRAWANDETFHLTIIEGDGEDLTPESPEVVAALAAHGWPTESWELA